MGYKDKIKRIEEARTSDEEPLVAVLQYVTQCKAYVNPAKTAKENQSGGDVKLKCNKDNYTHSFEMQVSRKYKNFSYGKAKTMNFVGEDGGPCWVVLGCLDEDEKSIFYCMVDTVTLNKLLEDENNVHVRLLENKYYVIKPEALIGVKNKWMGNSLSEVVSSWWAELTNVPT